ncbi:Rid family hydrolase [Cellulomonas sp. ATA003]|uniref:RidA family protein n=1 Tax=Cellulomonas sp. ATA003 TaxID=3073064 RepID=UPI002873E3DC|nr:Rid family hydrolase [Cellulomonas sp. ATA003]WNB86413.1 Rid family hydrolase [Cellulomonas sp. ATA003]
MKQTVSTTRAPRPAGPYTQGVVAQGLLWTAGFGPADPQTGEVPEGVRDQTRQVLRNVAAVLEEAGLDLGDVVKVTAHLQHLHRDVAGFNEVYAEMVPQPYPVRTTVGSDLADILVEIDVVAALRDPGRATGSAAGGRGRAGRAAHRA